MTITYDTSAKNGASGGSPSIPYRVGAGLGIGELASSEDIVISEHIDFFFPILDISVVDFVGVKEPSDSTYNDTGYTYNSLISYNGNTSTPVELFVFVINSEDISITEDLQIEQVSGVNVSDDITIGEEVNANSTLADIIVSEDVLINEEASFVIPTLYISSIDTVTVSEDIAVSWFTDVFLAEIITIIDVVSVEIALNISVYDLISITESVTETEPESSYLFDQITISENLTLDLPINISTQDVISITENIKLDLSMLVSVTDTVSITENTKIDRVFFINVNDNITISENLALETRLSINVNDSVIISEQIIPIASLGSIVETDNITISSFVTTEVFDNIHTFDTITISENVTTESFRFSPSIRLPHGRGAIMDMGGGSSINGSYQGTVI